MATKRSIAARPGRSSKRANRRSRQSRVSPTATPKTTQLPELSQVSPLDAFASLSERVQAERDRLFKALSIVECCRFATATKFEVNDSEYMAPAFEAICDLLNASVEELELVASACEKVAGGWSMCRADA